MDDKERIKMRKKSDLAMMVVENPDGGVVLDTSKEERDV